MPSEDKLYTIGSQLVTLLAGINGGSNYHTDLSATGKVQFSEPDLSGMTPPIAYVWFGLESGREGDALVDVSHQATFFIVAFGAYTADTPGGRQLAVTRLIRDIRKALEADPGLVSSVDRSWISEVRDLAGDESSLMEFASVLVEVTVVYERRRGVV